MHVKDPVLYYQIQPPSPSPLGFGLSSVWQFFVPNMKNTTWLALTMPLLLNRKEKHYAFGHDR